MLELDDIAEIIADAVKDATAPLIARIADLEQRELVLPEKGDAGEQGPQGEPGPAGEVDMDAVKALISDAVAALPAAEKGEPGRDVDMDDVQRRIDVAVKSAVEALPAPQDGIAGKDGLGLANALIDRDGCLVVTFTDGSDKNLGAVVGKDGAPGKDGETFTLDDFDIVPLDDERSFDFRFTRGNVCHSFEFSFPVIIDRGVWKAGKAFTKGDAVTWGGSLWIAQRDEPGKPDTPDSGWRLAVKKGQPGKDAVR